MLASFVAHLAHVFIGRFDLIVPLSVVLVGAAAVVAASFGLVYMLPARSPGQPSLGPRLPRVAVMALQTLALAYLAFLVGVGCLGRQSAVLNAAVVAFWVLTIPLLPLLHCICGGIYEVANPFALLARLLTGGASARERHSPLVNRLGYWPAVGFLFLLFWFELAFRVVPNSPFALAVLAVVYTVVQVALGAILGEAWYRGGDVFQAITSLASSIAGIALVRDGEGFVRVRRGFDMEQFIPQLRGRQALITLWLAGVLADGVLVTPIWKAVTSATAGFTGSLGQASSALGTVDLGDLLLDSSEIVATWAAFAAFFWVFTWLAAALSRRRPGELAPIVAPSLIPIALAYLLAHNLTQMLVIGPIAFGGAGLVTAASAALVLSQNAAHLSPPIIFSVEVGAIVLGHVLAVVIAHNRVAQVERDATLAVSADLGWLSAMLIYTATSLWVIAQNITNG